ncbi:hypothetical protein E4T48_06438 [Aureobasidium sp. EXF-10727]|nr:hypothetical protein E4T48_06438 [Aureobasidium sp. EXF-10727]
MLCGDGKWRRGCLERIVRYATLFFGIEWLNSFSISGPVSLLRGCTPPSPQPRPAILRIDLQISTQRTIMGYRIQDQDHAHHASATASVADEFYIPSMSDHFL